VDSNMAGRRRIGVIGYGNLGQYLAKEIIEHPDTELAFVWNRTVDKIKDHLPEFVLEDLDDLHSRTPDLIIEVAHPMIIEKYGEMFLEAADLMVGSPTALAKQELEVRLRNKADSGTHGLYIPAGAFWGGEDIQKMSSRGTLKALRVTMKKHPSAFKLEGYLAEKNMAVQNEAVVLYDGPVRGLCPLAPNNVNTMAAAALAAPNLGFDGVRGCLVSDPSLDCHIVEIDVDGPGLPPSQFSVKTVRRNPASSGVVTGSATYGSFWSSVLGARGRGSGVHLC